MLNNFRCHVFPWDRVADINIETGYFHSAVLLLWSRRYPSLANRAWGAKALYKPPRTTFIFLRRPLTMWAIFTLPTPLVFFSLQPREFLFCALAGLFFHDPSLNIFRRDYLHHPSSGLSVFFSDSFFSDLIAAFTLPYFTGPATILTAVHASSSASLRSSRRD